MRSLSKIIATYNLYLNLKLSSPSFSTVKLWIEKIGYTKLCSNKEKAEDWILILDESIGIGQEKVLVVLGIRQSNIDFSRPLTIQDMEPILVKSSEKWTGQEIAKELNIIKEKLGTVIYSVTDAGSTLKAGIKEANIGWVYDVTHATAIILDKIYRTDEIFKSFIHNAGQMRFKNCCGKNAHLIPPNQRSKSRFLNIDILSNWAIKALNAYDRNEISEQERCQLKWLKENEFFILEMNQLISTIQEISVTLKHDGLCKKTMKKCFSYLDKCTNGKLLQFKKLMIAYLKDNIKNLTKKTKKLLCCSDVIESTFGKYKNELSKNPMSGITDLVLIIPALTAKLTIKSVNEAIDNCTVKDIQKWGKENLCESILTKRKMAFKN